MRRESPVSVSAQPSVYDSLARDARRPVRSRRASAAVQSWSGSARAASAPAATRMVVPAADVVSWDSAPGADARVADPAAYAPPVERVDVAPPAAAPEPPPAAPPPAAPESPAPGAAPQPPPPSVAQGTPYIDGGRHRVHALGNLVSDTEVERALEEIRNPRLRRSPDRQMLDGFLDHLAKEPVRAASAPPPSSDGLRLPPAPSDAWTAPGVQQVAPPSPPPSPRDLDMATVAGVAALSGSGGSGSAPPSPPPPAPVPAPPATAPPPPAPVPVLVISESVGRGGRNLPADVRAVKRRLVALGFNWLTVDETADQSLFGAITLFQAIKNGHFAPGTGDDGLIEHGKNTHLWLQAANAPRWQVLPAGSAAEGYENVERADTSENYDYGTDWLAGTIAAAGAAYERDHRAAHPTAALLSINDASLPRGIPQPGETADHAGHQTGLEVDVRLPRTNGTSGGITHTSAVYDRDAMRAMLTALRAQPLHLSVFFNDATLIGEGLCTKVKDHDNHAHVRIKPPSIGPAATAQPDQP